MPIHNDNIKIKVDGETIDGTLVTPGRKMPAVLFVHGWGGSQEQYLARAREIAALGCVCLTFDLRGHAETLPQQDTVSRENNLHDVLAAYDTLVSQRGVDPSSVAVVGSSYGGYLAAILTSMRPVKWLALRVPALYRDSNWEMPKRELHNGQDLGEYRQSQVPAEENRALRACSDFRGDVLVVESERDKIIPHAVITSYLEACTEPRSMTYRVIKGADHGLSEESYQRAYTSLLVSWMTEMIFGSREDSKSTSVVTMPESTLPEAPPTPG
ncbi:alpha/beta hydrolase family protein [Herbaspirillum sp. GCM10030257]|uniref:alpha/beta hydrolase family protein n=1 Tax=Herbaspirillum sp. GCM10030257 TaxID=3273393 RepID=UPI003615333B